MRFRAGIKRAFELIVPILLKTFCKWEHRILGCRLVEWKRPALLFDVFFQVSECAISFRVYKYVCVHMNICTYSGPLDKYLGIYAFYVRFFNMEMGCTHRRLLFG